MAGTGDVRILHVTDFHIGNPDDTNEHLRTGFLDDYIVRLQDALHPHLKGSPVNVIAATGDFVEKGNVDHFSHARRVLEGLCRTFGVAETKVVICGGNHDLVQSHDKDGRTKEARAAFNAFADSFKDRRTRREQSDRAILDDLGDGVWALTLDATLGAAGGPGPGTLDGAEVDTIVRWVKTVPPGAFLLIGTHYPVRAAMDEAGPFDEENNDYFKRHVWLPAAPLWDRIGYWRRGSRTLWLCGDIHREVHIVVDQHDFVATGRFGTATGATNTEVPRQARLISYRESDRTALSYLAEFRPEGHRSQAQMGAWFVREVTPREARPGSKFGLGPRLDSPSMLPAADTVGTDGTSQNSAVSGKSDEKVGVRVDVISEALEEEILTAIRRRRLYHLGRFQTSAERISLCWVSIGPLLNEGELLSQVVSHMAGWVRAKASELSAATEQVLLIGLDCWGAALASQLSAVTGARSVCVVSRDRGQQGFPTEGVEADLRTFLERTPMVVLVSDVVASGESCGFVYESLTKGVEPAAVRAKWLSLSVLCDQLQQGRPNTFLEGYATACRRLRMPVVASSALPDEDILPPTIKFE